MPPAGRGSEAPPGTRDKFRNQKRLYPVAYFPIPPIPPHPPAVSPCPLLRVPLPIPAVFQDGGKHSVFSSLPSVDTLMGASEGERDSQAPSPGLYTPLLLVQGGKKGPGAKRFQASSSQRGWLIPTDSLEITPGPPPPPPTSPLPC